MIVRPAAPSRAAKSSSRVTTGNLRGGWGQHAGGEFGENDHSNRDLGGHQRLVELTARFGSYEHRCVEQPRWRPTLYGADLVRGALSESVFHDVPVRGKGRRIEHKALVPMVRSTVIPKRDLRLVKLHSEGLTRLGVTHGELIESSSRQYPRTAAWGQALYDVGDYDGPVWRSRQFNDSYAVMPWGDRVVRRKDIDVDETNAPLSLYAGIGFDEVQQHANDCLITVID